MPSSERDLFTGVIQLANVLTRRLAPIFDKAKITPQQWSVLAALADSEGGSTLVSLARRLNVTKQNMTGMISRLEQQGLAERNEDPNDLRSSRVQLTRRGRGLVERLRPVYAEWLQAIGDDTERLAGEIDRLINRLEDE
ncbi:MAG TPA: MarR family transcriptional regulator [Thermoanaerobaculia bacterium]